jgi:hypothetical protein
MSRFGRFVCHNHLDGWPSFRTYAEFLHICRSGDMQAIHRMHYNQILPLRETYEEYRDPRIYTQFMGEAYNALKGSGAPESTLLWFQIIAAENHQLR